MEQSGSSSGSLPEGRRFKSCSRNFLCSISVTIQQPLSREVFWHIYAKIPRHTSKNAITEGDFKCIFARKCEGTEQLPILNKIITQTPSDTFFCAGWYFFTCCSRKKKSDRFLTANSSFCLLFFYFYSRCARISSALSGERYAGATSKTVLHPVIPSAFIRLSALA